MPCRTIARSTRRTGALALALVGLTLLTACTDPFRPRTRGRALTVDQRAAQFEVPADRYAALGYRLDWRGFPGVGRAHRIVDLHIADDNNVAVVEAGTTVSLLEGDTGRLRWRNRVATDLTRVHGVTRGPNGRVVCVAETELYFLDQNTGELVDRQDLAKLTNTMIITEGLVAIYGTSTGQVATHLMTRGLPLWGFAARGSFEANPVRIGEAIGAVSRAGDIVFLRANGGDLLGRARIFEGTAPGVHPTSSETLFFVASLDQSVYAFAPTGQQIWRHRTGTALRAQPTYLDGTLYVTTEDGFTAINAANGSVRWATTEALGVAIGARRGLILVWDPNTQTAAALDPSDGAVVERVTLPGVRTLRMSRPADGDLYAISDTAVVAKFVPTR